MKPIRFVFLASFYMLNLLTFAQAADAEDCKDHPFFNRISGFLISNCTENFNQIEIPIGINKMKTIEGNVSKIIFSENTDIQVKLPSQLQVIKNFENAVLKINGKKIFSSLATDDEDFNGVVFNFTKDKTEYWVKVELVNDPVNEYVLNVVSIEAMKQEITANEMLESINSGNALALYINFENGKAVVKTDSNQLVEEIYQLLLSNPSLKINIEGHTDDVGNKIANQSLSEQRSESLKQILIKKGVKQDRIKTIGFGQTQPIGDNASEIGRKLNRRVEIRKIN